MIKKLRRTVINAAILRPSFVMVSFHNVTSGSPGVRSRLHITVKSIRNTIAFIPFTMNLKGTFDSLITITRKIAAIA